MASSCLVFHMKGYHVFCNWKNSECEHPVKHIDAKGEAKYVNHCKYCLAGMVETLKEPWAWNDEGQSMKNPFICIL